MQRSIFKKHTVCYDCCEMSAFNKLRENFSEKDRNITLEQFRHLPKFFLDRLIAESTFQTYTEVAQVLIFHQNGSDTLEGVIFWLCN